MSVGKKAVLSSFWVAAGKGTANVINFAGGIALMRLLFPKCFGIVAFATFLLSLFSRIRDWGFDHSLTYRQDADSKVLGTHAALHALMAAVTAAVVLLASFALRSFYDQVTVDVLLALACIMVVESLGATPAALLEKELLFGRAMVIEVAATAIWMGSSILLVLNALNVWPLLADQGLGVLGDLGKADLRAGIWALVGGRAISIAFRTIAVWVASPRRPSFRLDRSEARWFFRFGSGLWIASMMTFVVLEVDDFIVGSIVSTLALGFYRRAYGLSLLPLGITSGVLTKVSFPTYAKLQGDRDRLSQAFNLVAGMMFRIAAPMCLALVAVAREFVILLPGEEWLPMVPILQLLAAYALMRPMVDDVGGIFVAGGRPDIVRKIITLQACCLLVTCPIMTKVWDANGAAIAVGIATLLGLVLAYGKFVREFVAVQYVRVFVLPLVSAGIAGGCAFLVAQKLPAERLILTAAVKLGVIAVTYLVALVALDHRRMFAEVRALVNMARRSE